jgi:hypothetical protein
MNTMFFSMQQPINQQPKQVFQSVMPFSVRYTVPPTPKPAPIRVSSSQQPETKKMKWGEPTWFLLHTLAEKIRDEDFHQIKAALLKQIYAICTNLPCPICATHARDYLNGINFSTIQNKDALKKMLFQFHNEVNANKGYQQFAYDDLTSKYRSAVTTNIISYFLQHFQEKQYNIQLISNNIFRERVTKDFKEWISANIQSFQP